MPENTSDTSHTEIFGRLPADVFNLFTGSNRYFFADLLEYLDAEVFGLSGGIQGKTDVIAAIGEFIDRQYRELDLSSEPDEGPGQSVRERREGDPRKYTAFHRLLATGWLVVHRDRYRPIVDFDPDARLLLQALLDIKNERVRSYGGEVLKIKALLDSAINDPHEQSENIRNAARSAAGFLSHLRTVVGRMRKIEETLIEQTSVRDILSVYFDEKITEQVISDYKRLNTRENPFRFRMEILNRAQEALSDTTLLEPWRDAWVREGHAGDAEQAERLITKDLQDIVRVFEALDDHIRLIQDTQGRIERRIRNAVRFMDQIEESNTARLAEAIRKLGASGLADDAPVSVRTRFLDSDPPLGPRHLYQKAQRTPPPKRTPIEPKVEDAVVQAYEDALEAFQLRVHMTSQKLNGFAEQALGGRQEIKGSEIDPYTLDDFFAFERLSEINLIFDELLAGRYEVQFTGDWAENAWLQFPDFILRRRAAAAGGRDQEAPAHG